jgi:hypothetical protein
MKEKTFTTMFRATERYSMAKNRLQNMPMKRTKVVAFMTTPSPVKFRWGPHDPSTSVEHTIQQSQSHTD